MGVLSKEVDRGPYVTYIRSLGRAEANAILAVPAHW